MPSTAPPPPHLPAAAAGAASGGAFAAAAGRSSGSAPSAQPPDCGWPEEPRVVAGNGRHAGRPPRGAGIIAFQPEPAGLLVCLVEKRNGKRGFPKGGLKREVQETVMQGAQREFHEETGIPLGRLELLQRVVVDCDFLGVRYLVAWCAAAQEGDPDAGRSSWAPPFEDPTDNDPIVAASWVSCDEVLANRVRGCQRSILDLLQRALEHAKKSKPPQPSQSQAKQGDRVSSTATAHSPCSAAGAPPLAARGELSAEDLAAQQALAVQGLNSKKLPLRPGRPACAFFLRTGKCKHGQACVWDHLETSSCPRRPGQRVCTLYWRTRTCKFGPYCVHDHPSGLPDPAAVSSELGARGRELPLELEMASTQQSQTQLLLHMQLQQEIPTLHDPEALMKCWMRFQHSFCPGG